MNHRLLASSLLPLAALVAGCHLDLTSGDEGNADFSYVGFDCLLGCEVEQPMMLGTTEGISVMVDRSLAGLTASSDNPSVLTASMEETFYCCTHDGQDDEACADMTGANAPCQGAIEHDYVARVKAVGVGKAHLVVKGPGGDLVDQVELSVAKAARVEVPLEPGAHEISLQTSELLSFVVQAFDAGGQPLRASEGFQIAVTDPSVAGVRGSWELFAPEDSASTTFADIQIEAHAPGKTALNIKAPDATSTVPVTVH